VLAEKKQIILKSFGLHVKNIRIKKTLTQVEVSSRMNKDQQSLQRVESGNVSPSLNYLIELAEALDVIPAELITFKIKERKK
jgi:transcriptional regulator with XRE-family HTH domain